MEPGHCDRENTSGRPIASAAGRPQWSPVIATGKTGRQPALCFSASTPAMEPGHCDRENQTSVTGFLHRELPAMEPGHCDRENQIGCEGDNPGNKPAMEPGHCDRENRSSNRSLTVTRCPQWSPVIATGKTTRRAADAYPNLPPAMEPGHCDRENPCHRAPAHPNRKPAMEPGHCDRENVLHLTEHQPSIKPAMEPGHCDRENHSDSTTPTNGWDPQWSPVITTGKTTTSHNSAAATGSRNGARSLRPGKPAHCLNATRAASPQWSPVIATGKTRVVRNTWVVRANPAMEPGHCDRENDEHVGDALRQLLPAMEPGHCDRENGHQVPVGSLPRTPQWSPVIATGKTDWLLFVALNSGPPAMEPGHCDRENIRVRRDIRAMLRPRNGARSLRPGKQLA